MVVGMSKRKGQMSRRRFLRQATLGATACAVGTLTGCRTAPSVSRHRPPNIVFFLVDDLGYGDLGFLGQERFATPHLDRMARESLHFTQFYCGSPLCAPSRYTLLTGQHTGHAYIRSNSERQPEGQLPLPKNSLSLPLRMRQLGYQTGCVGKWGFGMPETTGAPDRQGFSHFFGYYCHRAAHRHYPESLWRNRTPVALPGNHGNGRGDYAPTVIAEEAHRFIRQHRDSPFFLYWANTLPHADLDAPESLLREFRGRYPEIPFPGNHYREQPTPRAAYAAMVTAIDQQVGALLAMLQDLGIAENTLVLFATDNGPAAEGGADPEFFRSSGPYRGVKRSLYEGGIRTPLLAWQPGVISPGESSHIGAFWDFPATCLELLGEPPMQGNGVSFAPTLRGEPDHQEAHNTLYWEIPEHLGQQAMRMGEWKAVRRRVMENAASLPELYHLPSDPGETTNYASEMPHIAEYLGHLLWTDRTESTLFPLLPG